MRKITIVILLGVLLLQYSCTSNKSLVYLKNHPSQGIQTSTKKSSPITIQEGDVLSVQIVSINPEINKMFNSTSSNNALNTEASVVLSGYSVGNTGYIKIPVIDTVKVIGLTITEAEAVIQTKVDSYFKNASVIIRMLNSKISVLGEVNRPGSFAVYKNEINVFEAIAMAGDVTQFANKKRVLIIRTTKDNTISYKIDLTDINILSNKNFFLQPNDVVIVESAGMKSFRLNSPTVSLFFTGLTAVITTLSFFLVTLNN